MFKIEAFVEDKHLATALRALSGIARDVRPIPVINAEPDPAHPTKVRAQSDAGSAAELFVAEVRKLKLPVITVQDTKKIIVGLGLSKTSYSHILSDAVKRKLLKKSTTMNGANGSYTWTLPS